VLRETTSLGLCERPELTQNGVKKRAQNQLRFAMKVDIGNDFLVKARHHTSTRCWRGRRAHS
jgi:hypothetical protein